ncbi:MAG TPA: amidase family protein [Rhizomicrobium sp.]|nr:amidase family protein [Rhizomicrobium sp.]
MGFAEYDRYDAIGLADLIKTKKISALEALDEAIARTEKLNPKLNAIVFKAYDRARDAAKANPQGPLGGVPFLLKDMRAACTGMVTRSGSRFTPDVPATQDCTLVARHKQAGLVPFGKTNVPEFGLIPTTESKLWGPAHNPWKHGYTTGGSSGGSAAAVAAGIVPIAHATDGGGSIRIPASCCGLVGLKVSRGRITQGPDAADSLSGLSVDNLVSRTVRDTAAVLDLTSAPDYGDPYFALQPETSYLEGIKQKPKRLKIAVAFIPPSGAPFDPQVTAAMKSTVKLCEDLGHIVEEATPDFDFNMTKVAFMTLWATNGAYSIELLSRLTDKTPSLDNLEGLTFSLYERGKTIGGMQHIWAVQLLHRAARAAAKFHETHDLWLTPTLGQLPFVHGTIDRDDTDTERAFIPIMNHVPFTALQNASGQPAINLPLHMSEEGLPIGVQFVARSGDEMTLLKLAAEIEQAAPWIDRRPKLEN